MKKIFISQPMKGKSNEEIKKERELIINDIEAIMEDEQFVILDTVFEDFKGATPLKFLAKSLMVLADADYAYFAEGWECARGCRIEHECALEYRIILLED